MKDERHETIEQSVTDCNHLGNAAKMREALSRILGTVEHLQTRFDMPKLASEEILELKQIAESALSAPPRNCDVGTAEEQAERLSPRGETKTLLLVNGRDIIKAQRIVAELAKVMPSYMAGKPGHSFIETEAYKAYRNCYAIAEKGAEDDK